MNKLVSPVVAAVIIVVVPAVIAFAGYKLFLQREKPLWSPGTSYGAPGYDAPMDTPSTSRECRTAPCGRG